MIAVETDSEEVKAPDSITNKNLVKDDPDKVNRKGDERKQNPVERGLVGSDDEQAGEIATFRAALTKADAKTVFLVQVIERLHAATSFSNMNLLLLLEQLGRSDSEDQGKAKVARNNARGLVR